MTKNIARVQLIWALFSLAPSTFPIAWYALVLHMLGMRQTFSLRISGRWVLFPSISELYTAKQIFLNKIYDVPLKDAQTIVDLGANIGLASVFFALKYPNAQIDAYEPDPVTFQYLVENSKGLHISCHQLAVANTRGKLPFHRNRTSVASSFFKLPDSTVETVQVVTILPEDLPQRVDILKIDIEETETTLIGHHFSARFVIGESTDSEAIGSLFSGMKITWTVHKGIFLAEHTT